MERPGGLVCRSRKPSADASKAVADIVGYRALMIDLKVAVWCRGILTKWRATPGRYF